MGGAIKGAIANISPIGQTYTLESFHNVILSFAPKMLSFGYSAMYSR